MATFADYNAVMRSDFSLHHCPRIGPFTYHNLRDDDADEDPLTLSSYRRSPQSAVVTDASIVSGTGELLTADPLDTSNRLGENGRCWKLAVTCPVPRSVPKVDVKKGTTTLGFHFDGGIILAVDSRASAGQYIASQTVMKVLEINDYMLGTMAGGAADCQYWERVLGMECRLWELRNGTRITVAAASKILAMITYRYRNHGLSMGTMIAGWDQFGPSLYYVDDKGTRVKQDLFSVGSGSIYAYGVLDQGYRKDLSVEEACDLARRSIFHATYRDAASGGIVTVYHVHKNGWTQISRNDQTALFEQYSKPTMADYDNDKRPRVEGSNACRNCGQEGHYARECPSAPSASDNTCFKCGQAGHFSRECPNAARPGAAGDRACFNCGEMGHMSRDCPNAPKSGVDPRPCYTCGEPGHMSRDCPRGGSGGYGAQKRGREGYGFGGDRACYSCGEFGHMSRDCPRAGAGAGGGTGRACYSCGGFGHMSRDCPKSGGRACFNCGAFGHMSRDCPSPPKPGVDPRPCFNCGESGHMSRECPKGGSVGGGRACYNCGEFGHMSRDCPTAPQGGARGGDRGCYNCGESGHMSRDCPTRQ